ncbi:MAG: sigma 54-interacting transcriptional regulator, partial [Oscillospiraceae bacterium]
YVGGAFTGANRAGAKGKFELADGGTLFLDEIGEMPTEMQSVLLRVLEDNSVTRIGGNRPVPVDVRLITATNRNLQAYIREGKFRLDLYYRLNVIILNMIPLHERRDD